MKKNWQKQSKSKVTVFNWKSVIQFGSKHRGMTIREISKIDPAYLIWCDMVVEWFELSDVVYKEVWRLYNLPEGNQYDFK